MRFWSRTRLTFALLGVAVLVATGVAVAAGAKPAKSLLTDAQICSQKQNQNGTLTFSFSYLIPNSFDPITSAGGSDVNYMRLMYGSLTSIDGQGNPQPDLATSWKYSKDGLTLTFTLRKGLKFTDGTPLNAQAAAQSFLRLIQAPNSTQAAALGNVSGVSATGARTLVFTLKNQDYQLPQILGGRAGMIVSPTAFTTNPNGLKTNPVGDGPFKEASFQEGGIITLVRNPDYWNAKNVHLAKIVINYINDESTRIAAMQSGQLDLGLFSGSSVATLRKAGFKVIPTPSLQDRDLNVNATVAPFNDSRVVEAINYALNRRAIVDTLEAGFATPNWQPFPPGYVAYNPSLKNRYPYNPKKAKQLLAAAGYAGGLKVTLGVIQTLNFPQLAEVVQGMLAQVGITITLKPIPISQHVADDYVNHINPFFTDGFAGRESPLLAVSVLWGPQGLLNPGRQYPPLLARAVTKAAAVPLSDPAYPKLIQEVTRAGVDNQPTIWLYSPQIPVAISSKVHGFKPNPVQTQLDIGMCVTK